MKEREKEIEETIRRAMWVDRKLPPVKLNEPQSPLSTVIISQIPAEEHLTNEDLQIWNKVMFEWLPLLSGESRDIVKKRCAGMGWKRIAYELSIGRATACRKYKKSICLLSVSVLPDFLSV